MYVNFVLIVMIICDDKLLKKDLFPIRLIKELLFSRSVMSDSLRPHGLYSPPGSSVHGIL